MFLVLLIVSKYLCLPVVPGNPYEKVIRPSTKVRTYRLRATVLVMCQTRNQCKEDIVTVSKQSIIRTFNIAAASVYHG